MISTLSSRSVAAGATKHYMRARTSPRQVRCAVSVSQTSQAASRKEHIKMLLEKAYADAELACKDKWTASACLIALDKVRELEFALNKLNEREKEPLEAYCDDHPDCDECRIYEV